MLNVFVMDLWFAKLQNLEISMNMLRDSSGPVEFCLVFLGPHAIRISDPAKQICRAPLSLQTPFGFWLTWLLG